MFALFHIKHVNVTVPHILAGVVTVSQTECVALDLLEHGIAMLSVGDENVRGVSGGFPLSFLAKKLHSKFGHLLEHVPTVFLEKG